MWKGNGGVLPSSTHGEVTWYSPASVKGGIRRGKGSGDLRGVLSTNFEVGGVLGREMSSKDKQPRGV